MSEEQAEPRRVLVAEDEGLIRLDIVETLTQAGIPPQKIREELPRIVEAVLEDPCIETNPIPVEEFVIRRILEEAGGRG